MKKGLIMVFSLLALPLFSQETSPLFVWEQAVNDANDSTQRANLLLAGSFLSTEDFIQLQQNILDKEIQSQSQNRGSGLAPQSQALLIQLLELGASFPRPALINSALELLDRFQEKQIRIFAIETLALPGGERHTETLIQLLSLHNDNRNLAQRREVLPLVNAIIRVLGAHGSRGSFQEIFETAKEPYPEESGIRELALSTLRSLVSDPTDELLTILEESGDLTGFEIVLELVQGHPMDQTLAPFIALNVLRIARQRLPNSTRVRALQETGLKILINYNDRDPAKVELLKYFANPGERINSTEALLSISALGVNGSDQATEALGELLSPYHARENQGLNTREDYIRIRALVIALGRTSNFRAMDFLNRAEEAQYPPEILDEIMRAISALP